MVINPGNIARHELVGLTAKIIDSTNKSDVGITGKVVDETKNIIIIGEKKILKQNVKIEFMIGNEKVVVDGKELSKNPVERTKIR